MSLHLARARQIRRARQFSFLGIIVSLGVASFGAVEYGAVLLDSPFWLLFSLLFSDLGIIAGSFQDFFYSLLETLPLVPLLFLFAPLTLLFWSLSFLSKYMEQGSERRISHGLLS